MVTVIWIRKENARIWIAVENHRMGKRGKTKERKTGSAIFYLTASS